MPRYDFSGKVAFVTGGASGIGAACVEQFAANGAAVAIVDRSADLGEDLLRRIAERGGRALFIATDITDAAAVQRAVDDAMAVFGRLDMAVNSAGISGESRRLLEYSMEGWHRVLATNLNGVFYSLRCEIPALLASGGGAIVNIASVMALVSSPYVSAYVAAKHAVAGLTKAAAQAYGAQGLRINAVCPGYIQTPMMMQGTDAAMREKLARRHPIGRLGVAEDIASVAVFLCSEAAGFMTGGLYPVDGGYLTQ